MDTAAQKLSKYVYDLRYEHLPPQVVQRTKRLILDTIGCALGAYTSEPCVIARSIVDGLGGTPESTIIGSGARTSCANAVLANGSMIRYLDFNDSRPSFGHPSDCIGEALAVAEREHASGKDLILAVVLGYEIQARLRLTFALPNFEQHTLGSFASPVIAGKLLGLDAEQIANAIGIAGSHNFTIIGLYGEGHISMMKCIAYAFAAQSGVTAALLAQKGFTGPVSILESYNKNFEGNVPLTPLAEPGQDWAILQSWMKSFEAFHMAHSSITATIDMARQHSIQPADVEAIHVTAFKRLLQWVAPAPESKEEADHSLPYVLAIALMEGAVGPNQYAHEQWKDPAVLELMGKIKFHEDAELAKLTPECYPSVVEIRTKGGKQYRQRVDYPRGSPKNPMTDEEIEGKFRSLASHLLPENRIKQIIRTAYHLEEMDDISSLMELLVIEPRGRDH